MRVLIEEDFPCWYELSWQEKKPAIILRIHEDFIKDFKPTSESSVLVRHFMEEFKFTDFAGNLNSDFGFNKALKFVKEKNDFSEFLIELPVVRKKASKTCSLCNGSGESSFLEENCLSCNGSGKQDTYNWQPTDEISASLSMLLSKLKLFERKTSASFPQLLTVQTVTQRSQNGGALGGTYGVSLCKWLRSLEVGIPLSEVVQAIKTAYSHMFAGLRGSDENNLKAYLNTEAGSLIINCPGNSCGLHPSDWCIEEGQGYHFSSHNVDTSMQQLTLLSGLAALHDKARKEINS